jgi:hypothetical protein
MLPGSASNILPYADLPQRWGVTCDRDGDVVRLHIPPVPGWKQLGRGLFVAIGTVGAIVITFVIVAVRNYPFGDAAPFFANAAMYGAVMIILALVAWERVHRRIVIEITPRTLRIARLVRGRPSGAYAWPRERVREVKFSRGNGKLLIRIAGADMVELFVSPKHEVTEWVAKTLNEAIHAGAPVTTHSRPQEWTDNSPPPMPRGPARTALLAVAVAIALLGVIMVIKFGPPAIYIVLAAIVPVGIAMGSQKKEFWM